ncbi:hypothetical protein AMJ71_01815 [candidate division TA06 bacterium SM1_40]|uniref:ATPase BadF/BadG/BcrA/BcrD type domain-containing protein n=1 Tax=candidate division TA06 bacterium SM1_40 TaxID=1703773 RepID=A0A0S8JM34_UNCT6|nr:MAG: hypothetical protein AMJ71_01815 [candidate division TA06 bacterium SM1_40]
MEYVIGIDGGGSASTATLVALDGTVLAQLRGGPGNYLLSGVEPVARVMAQLVAEGKILAEVEREIPRSICLALAGAGRPRAQRTVLDAVRERIPAQDILVTSDGVAALVSAFPGRSGVALIAGTGSLAMAVDERGGSARAGGWGHLLGDDGSGYDLGRRAVMAALAAQNGSGDETLLLPKLAAHIGLSSIDDVIDWVYGDRDAAVSRLASLAPLVFDAAGEGDRVSATILDQAGQALAHLVDSVIKQLRLDSVVVPLCPFGGLFRDSYALLERVIARTSVEIEIVPPRFSPSLGASLVALGRADVDLDADLLNRLDRSERAWRCRSPISGA